MFIVKLFFKGKSSGFPFLMSICVDLMLILCRLFLVKSLITRCSVDNVDFKSKI